MTDFDLLWLLRLRLRCVVRKDFLTPRSSYLERLGNPHPLRFARVGWTDTGLAWVSQG